MTFPQSLLKLFTSSSEGKIGKYLAFLQALISTKCVTIPFMVQLLACSKYYYITVNWYYFRVRSTLSIGVTLLNN